MKIIDTKTLKRLTQQARNHRLNRLLDGRDEVKLDPWGKHILSHALLHGDGDCIRCFACFLKLEGQKEPLECVLDIPVKEYNQLPEHGDQN